MKVVFDERFIKDAKKIKDITQKQKIRKAIAKLEQADSLKVVDHLKKLKGHQTAYRLRVGNFRIGFFTLVQETIELVRVMHRKDIYSNFP